MFGTWISVVAVLGLLVGAAGWWLGNGRWTEMPTVTGVERATAERLLLAADLVAAVTVTRDDAVAAGLVSYVAATATIALLLLWPGQFRHALAVTPESRKWFTYSGVSVSIAQMFIYMAYAVAPLSVVTPILQLHLVLRLVFSRALNPHHEIFGGRMVLGTALSVLGAVALSLDVEHVLALVPLPPAIAAFARWHWP